MVQSSHRNWLRISPAPIQPGVHDIGGRRFHHRICNSGSNVNIHRNWSKYPVGLFCGPIEPAFRIYGIDIPYIIIPDLNGYSTAI